MLLTEDAPARTQRIDPAFRRDILEGLGHEPKSTPPIWFYDRRGSELFEQITDLPEYYPTRTETALLKAHGPDVARAAGAGRAVVEASGGVTLDRIPSMAATGVDLISTGAITHSAPNFDVGLDFKSAA